VDDLNGTFSRFDNAVFTPTGYLLHTRFLAEVPLSLMLLRLWPRRCFGGRFHGLAHAFPGRQHKSHRREKIVLLRRDALAGNAKQAYAKQALRMVAGRTSIGRVAAREGRK
jgi:hypothetical protein